MLSRHVSFKTNYIQGVSLQKLGETHTRAYRLFRISNQIS